MLTTTHKGVKSSENKYDGNSIIELKVLSSSPAESVGERALRHAQFAKVRHNALQVYLAEQTSVIYHWKAIAKSVLTGET